MKLNRREILQLGLWGGSTLLMPFSPQKPALAAPFSPQIPRFKTPLPIPPVLSPKYAEIIYKTNH